MKKQLITSTVLALYSLYAPIKAADTISFTIKSSTPMSIYLPYYAPHRIDAHLARYMKISSPSKNVDSNDRSIHYVCNMVPELHGMINGEIPVYAERPHPCTIYSELLPAESSVLKQWLHNVQFFVKKALTETDTAKGVHLRYYVKMTISKTMLSQGNVHFVNNALMGGISIDCGIERRFALAAKKFTLYVRGNNAESSGSISQTPYIKVQPATHANNTFWSNIAHLVELSDFHYKIPDYSNSYKRSSISRPSFITIPARFVQTPPSTVSEKQTNSPKKRKLSEDSFENTQAMKPCKSHLRRITIRHGNDEILSEFFTNRRDA